MKAIINGKRYDTDKATLIGETDNIGPSVSRNDFHFWEAGLYVTPRSRSYFLAGRGGPMSRFATSHGNSSWSGGEGVHPMTKQEAFEWSQQELAHKPDIIEAHFGDMIEDA